MEHLFVVCCVYRLWLFSLTASCSLGTVLIGMKPEVYCTSVASVVSLFIGAQKKRVTFVIKTFNKLHGFSHLLRSAPWGLLNKTSHITRGAPTLTTDRTLQPLPTYAITKCGPWKKTKWRGSPTSFESSLLSPPCFLDCLVIYSLLSPPPQPLTVMVRQWMLQQHLPQFFLLQTFWHWYSPLSCTFTHSTLTEVRPHRHHVVRIFSQGGHLSWWHWKVQ